MTSERFARLVESYVGTPYLRHGRTPGRGLDCIGVAIAAFDELGLEPDDWRQYGESPLQSDLLDRLDAAAFLRLKEGAPERGDVMCFRWPREIRHVGVCLGDGKIVRAAKGRGVHITAPDLKRLARVYEVID